MSTLLTDEVAQTLFGRIRREVLGLLYTNPERSYYLRELMRFANTSPGAIQRELAQLHKAGLVVRSRRGHQVFFQANLQSPVFEELRSLLAKTAGLAQILREALLPLACQLELAAVFGSFAAGSMQDESDIDLLVIGQVSLREVVTALQPAQNRLAREINPVVYARSECVRLLSEGQPFLTAVLEGPLLPILGDKDEFQRLAGQRLAD